MVGIVYLIPVTLGGEKFNQVIPEYVLDITRSLRFFVVEDIRTARRFLRMIDRKFPVDETVFFELNEHTAESDISLYLEPALKGNSIGLMSEAGLPGIADPGSMIVKLAHRMNIRVVPLSGPSSILLGLIASGLNGQNFTFHGYLPVKPAERNRKLLEIGKRSADGETQVFMETPYRAQKMMESIVEICQPGTLLCIASDITLATEEIKTMTISGWKRKMPVLKDRLVIFLLGA